MEWLAGFTVYGPPVGYYAQGRAPNFRRMNAYVAYKMHVQDIAATHIPLPLVATKERPLHIVTWAYFVDGVHADPDNIHKGIKDALFWAPKGALRRGADKYTGGAYSRPLYDRDEPRVVVRIYLSNQMHDALRNTEWEE